MTFTIDSNASMGPRRYRRGNRAVYRAVVCTTALQWGRDVIVAEISATRSMPCAGQPASMGPRRYRRGNGKTIRACIRNGFATPFRAGRILGRPVAVGAGWKRSISPPNKASSGSAKG